MRGFDELHRLRADALIVVGGVDEDHVEMHMVVACVVEDDAANAGVIHENGVALVLRDLLPHPFHRVVAGRTAEFNVRVHDRIVVEGGDLRVNEGGCVVGRGGADDRGGHGQIRDTRSAQDCVAQEQATRQRAAGKCIRFALPQDCVLPPQVLRHPRYSPAVQDDVEQ